MSKLHIRRIRMALESQFNGLIDPDPVQRSPEAQRAMFMTQALAAYVLTKAYDVDPVEAALSITDGFDDNGIDALHINAGNRKLVALQAKWDADGKGSPASGDVMKFVQGFRDLIDDRFDRFNNKIQRRRAEIVRVLDDANSTLELVLVHTGVGSLSPHATRILEIFVKS